jgi:hypothetical protein
VSEAKERIAVQVKAEAAFRKSKVYRNLSYHELLRYAFDDEAARQANERKRKGPTP